MCRNKIEILEIPCERLRSEAQKVFERMMGIRKGNSYSVYQQEEYIELQKKIESQMKIHVLLKKADSFLSEKHNIWMEEQKIEHVEFLPCRREGIFHAHPGYRQGRQSQGQGRCHYTDKFPK